MTTSAVPLRTRSACHQGPKSAKSFCYSEVCAACNLSNLDSFGILLTNRAFFHIVNKRTASVLGRARTVAFFDPNKRISRLAHPPFERTPKRSRVPGTEAGSLDWALVEVGRKERKGLLRLFGFVDFSCPSLHREIPKITGIACCVGTATRVTRLSSHAFDMPAGWGHHATTNAISESPVVRRTTDHSLLARTAWLHRLSGDPADADDWQDDARCLAHELVRKNRKWTR